MTGKVVACYAKLRDFTSWLVTGSVLHRRMICMEAAEDLLGQHKTSLAQGTFPDFFFMCT